MAGSQDIAEDPRNAAVRVWINGGLIERDKATISVFDGGFIAGDGVWEGLRLHRGRLLFLDEHLDRLLQGAAAIALDIGLDREGLRRAIQETCAANGMNDGVHIRLMVTRGLKKTPSQDPAQTIGPPSIVIVAEHKQPSQEVMQNGLTLATVSVRCTRPDQFDMRLNSHSRLPLIMALLQARQAGADEALMLDDAGYVSTCNATNFFFVRSGRVFTSSGRSCFNGITRGTIIGLCEQNAVPITCGDFTLLDVVAAEEAFVTGTFGGVTPVRVIDGRRLPAVNGPVTQQLAALYRELIDNR